MPSRLYDENEVAAGVGDLMALTCRGGWMLFTTGFLAGIVVIAGFLFSSFVLFFTDAVDGLLENVGSLDTVGWGILATGLATGTA